jgi:hypothetical protein
MTQVGFPEAAALAHVSGRERCDGSRKAPSRLRHMLCYHVYEKLCRLSNKYFLTKDTSSQRAGIGRTWRLIAEADSGQV